MHQTIAIVSTIRNADLVLNSFIDYHIAIGFDRIYLFFDNESERSSKIANEYPQVMIIPNNSLLTNIWKKLPTYSYHKKFIQSEVMSRQILNAEVAIKTAISEGINWLLHIDIDELFYVEGTSVKEHFKDLTIQGANNVSYVNCEAIPDNFFTKDFFKEITFFKKHPKLLSPRQIDCYRHLSIFNYGKDYFWFYGNGKSAVRVDSSPSADSVHTFKTKQKAMLSTNPVILHYPVCGFYHFWNKYKTLGDFDNKWFKKLDILSSMHLESRDVVCAGNKKLAKEFYMRKLQEFRDIKKYLVQKGLVAEKTMPSTLLNLNSK